MTAQFRCLGSVLEHDNFKGALNLPVSLAKAEVLYYLRSMLLIRETELVIAQLIRDRVVHCPCHLGVGQEAVAVGVASNLKNTDYLFGTHRSHSQYLAMGAGVYSLLAEVLGRATGCAKGLGGSMHLIAQEVGFMGSVPIVGATIPLAAGAALSAKISGESRVAVCFFGDGAAEEGVFHETLNIASVHKLPVLFVCENNLYASHLDITQRQSSDCIARFADAHCIPSYTIDGNDVFLVAETAKEAIEKIRLGEGPQFIEAVTYRWMGHVGPNEDIDVGVRRSQSDLGAWKNRDPIKRLVDALIDASVLSADKYEILKQEVRDHVQSALDQAIKDPLPKPETLFDNLYSN